MDVSPRKVARQARSRMMVDAILQGAARVVAAEGLARATTNRIAEVAGVSIGSLYQYFPNKLAIIRALQLDHGRAMGQLVADIQPAATRLPLDKTVRLLTDTILDGHLAVERLHREILSPTSRWLLGAEIKDIHRRMLAGIAAMLTGHRDVIAPPSVDLAAAFTFQIVTTLTHGAIDDPQSFPPTVVEREMPRIVVRYLVAGAE